MVHMVVCAVQHTGKTCAVFAEIMELASGRRFQFPPDFLPKCSGKFRHPCQMFPVCDGTVQTVGFCIKNLHKTLPQASDMSVNPV